MPVIKHDTDQYFTQSPDSLGVVKGQIFKLSQLSIFLLKFSMHTEVHTKRYFSLKSWVPPPEWTYGVWVKGQNSLFSEHGHVAYQIK